jgi:hypothetical protein
MDKLVREQLQMGILDVSDLRNYYWVFYTITQFLLTKNWISKAEQSRAFIRGFQPDLWHCISCRLKIKLPNHDPDKFYPLFEINKATKHVLHGTPQNSFLQPSTTSTTPPTQHHHMSKRKINWDYLSKWCRVFSKCSLHKSQWQTMPAPAPTPKRWLCWIHWAAHSAVNLAIFVRGHWRHICQWLAKATLTGVGWLKLVECHRPCLGKDMLYQIYIPQTTTDYHLLIVMLLA